MEINGKTYRVTERGESSIWTLINCIEEAKNLAESAPIHSVERAFWDGRASAFTFALEMLEV